MTVSDTATSTKTEQEAHSKEYTTPEWAKQVVWYQIFPERFSNGDPSNDPTADRVEGDINLPDDWEISPWTGDWYQRADWETKLGPDFRDGVFYRRYGGDLLGIMDKLDYLQELGIGAIYLNPIFDAVSLHKYDTSHYRHVDRFFGPDPEGDATIIASEDPLDPSSWQWTAADKLFLELIDEVHRRGMKIIIDGVFNHTGTDFWAFRDLQEKQQDSAYRDWYDVISFHKPGANGDSKFEYNGWWGVKDLPELKEIDGTLIEPVRNHIAQITRRWMDPNGDGDPSDGIDGWRLDVPEETGIPFWNEWCNVVRSVNPDAYISGEIWGDAAPNYINGDLFTAVMNYQFAEAVQDFMIDREIGADEFADRLKEVRESLPDEANYVLQNLMDSHDTARLASMTLNPGRKYNTKGKPEEGFSVRKPNEKEIGLQKLIALVQFTYVGAPMIYYGDEAGMWGATDPDNRKPMLWPDKEYEAEHTHPQGSNRMPDENRFNHELFERYKLLASVRNEHEIFQTGKFELVFADSEKDLFSYCRYLDMERFGIVVLNRSEHQQQAEIAMGELQPGGETLTDVLSGKEYAIEEGMVKCTLPPVSGVVLVPKGM
jgi:glycosidase